MDSVTKVVNGAVAGGMATACAVGALIATVNYMSVGPAGAVFYVVFLSAAVGALYGAALGGVIGLAVAISARGKGVGSLIGAGFGLVLAGFYFAQPPDPQHRAIIFGLSAIPICVVAALAAAMAAAWRWEP